MMVLSEKGATIELDERENVVLAHAVIVIVTSATFDILLVLAMR